MIDAASIVSMAATLSLAILALAFLVTVCRVVAGPTLPDRVVALDMLVAVAIGFIAVIAIKTGFPLYLDIAVSLGLVGFLATVAFARFILTGSATRPGSARSGAAIAAKDGKTGRTTATRRNPPSPRRRGGGRKGKG